MALGLFSEEKLNARHKHFQLIVMRPVTGALNVCKSRILEMLNSTIDRGIGGPGFRAADQQHGTGDAAP